MVQESLGVDVYQSPREYVYDDGKVALATSEGEAVVVVLHKPVGYAVQKFETSRLGRTPQLPMRSIAGATRLSTSTSVYSVVLAGPYKEQLSIRYTASGQHVFVMNQAADALGIITTARAPDVTPGNVGVPVENFYDDSNYTL